MPENEVRNKWGLVIAAPQSGSGKTTVVLALLAALTRRGYRVQPFKVGPDFIDPGYHSRITGLASRNLDGWMLSEAYNRSLFRRLLEGADGVVVEGVMGLYDGYDGTSEAGSTAQMAKWLDLPVLLVVDARSMARSVAALVYGFVSFDPALRWAGVIFNRVGSSAHYGFLKEAMTSACPHIPVLGGIPRDVNISLPERHLGLVTVDETGLEASLVDRLASLAEEHIRLDRLLTEAELAHDGKYPEAPFPGSEDPAFHKSEKKPPPWIQNPTIAVARDAAFCFYYQDNLELLEWAGARIRFFSPLRGETIPEDASAVILGGGYPEVHAEILSGNRRFFEDLRRWAARGRPVYGECGGLMVLGRSIELLDGRRIPMAGLLPFRTRMLERRKSLGYVEVVLRSDCLLGRRGDRLRGHEFHYSEIVADEKALSRCERCYRLTARKFREERTEGYRLGSVLASYVHLHWGSRPEAARFFVRAASEGAGS